MAYLSFPENLMIVPGLAPNVGGGAAQTSIPISLKNVQKLWAVCYCRIAANAMAFVPQSDTLVAFGSGAVLPVTLHDVPIWCNLDAGTSDVFTRQTDDSVYTTIANANSKIVVFEIDPSVLRTTATADADEDCFRISITDVPVGDYAAILYIIQPRYISKSDTRTYITD
jgi:hypothetical protein